MMPEAVDLGAVAAKMFGNKFVGEIPEPEIEAETQEPVDAAPEEPTEEQAEEQAEPEAEDVSEAEEAAEEQESIEIERLDDLAQALGVEPERLNEIKVGVKIDSEPGEASLEELVRSYQIQQSAERRLEDAKRKAAEINSFAEQIESEKQAVAAQAAVVAKMIEQAEALLLKDEEKIDWANLREDDPAEYSALKSDFADRRKAIERLKQEAGQEYQKTLVEQQQKIEERWQEVLRAEQAKLFELVPEWRDPGKAKQEQEGLVKFLMGLGYSESDISNLYDARAVYIALQAMRHEQQRGKTKLAEKKIKKIPKVVKPGAAAAEDAGIKQKLDQAKARLQKTGKMDDALAYLRAKRGLT